MKKILILFVVIGSMAFALISCLNSNFEDLDSFEGNEITGIVGVYHRYYGEGTDIIPGSGEVRVYQAPLSCNNYEKDVDNGIFKFTVKVNPQHLPESEVPKVTVSNLVVIVNISTAATIEPLPGSAQLGVPQDWSKPNQYKVIAANGNEKTWTVELKMLE